MDSENFQTQGEGQAQEIKAGFTLPELMIAVSILVIIGWIAVVSFRGFDQTSKLRGARDQVIGALQDMQSWARSGTLVNICLLDSDNITIDSVNSPRGICTTDSGCHALSNCAPAVPPGGYGIYFDQVNGKYILFADIFTSSPLGYNDPIEKLIDGEKILSSNIQFGLGTDAKWKDIYGGEHSSIYPIQVIFLNDGTISVLDTNSLRTQKIPLILSTATAYVNINKLSGLIYGDTDNLEPSGSSS